MNTNESYLHHCVINRNLSLLELLLEQGADINIRNEDEMTLLHIAANHHHEEELLFLLDREAKVNLKDKCGNTPLHIGIGSIKIVKALLDKGASPHCMNLKEETPLHLAAKRRYIGVVKLLINEGVDVNVKDKYHNTPLHFAVKVNSKEIIKMLIDKGANVNAKSTEETTPLHIAAQLNELSTVQLLLEFGADPNMTVKTITLLRAPPNNDLQGITPLHYAASNESQLVAQLLLESGADPNIKDGLGETPLHYTVRQNCMELTKLLIEKGASVNVENLRGNTPLFYAVDCKYLVVKLLLMAGANVNKVNKKGKSILHLSVLNSEIMLLLLKSGADVNCTDAQGNTPLHSVLVDRRAPITCENQVRALLDCGASIDIVNNKGYTPVYYDYSLEFASIFNQNVIKNQSIKLICNKAMNWKNFEPFQISCLKELQRMEKIKYGYHSVFDILSKYNDPFYVSNELLEKEIIDAKEKFPIYHLKLHTTFLRAKQRYRMLNEIEEYFSVTTIPVEIWRKIFSCLNDEDLRNFVNSLNEGL